MACNQHICDLGIFHDFLENIDIETWNLNSSLSGKYMALRVFVASELSFNCWGRCQSPLNSQTLGVTRNKENWKLWGKDDASVLSVLHCPIESNYTFLCIYAKKCVINQYHAISMPVAM